MVEVYVKRDHDKRVKWTSPRVFFKVDRSAWTATVPETRGNTMYAAVEDFLLVLDVGSFASHVGESNDALEEDISEVLYRPVGAEPHSLPAAQPADAIHPVRDLSYVGLSGTMVPADICPSQIDTADTPRPAAVSLSRHPFVPQVTRSVSQEAHRSPAPSDDRFPSQALPSSSVDHGARCTSGPFVQPAQGARIDVYWPQEQRFYPGSVQRLDEDGNSYLKYDDGDHVWFNLADEQ